MELVATLSTGPRMALANTMLFAVLRTPLASETMAEPLIDAVMPSLRSSRLRTAPSPSVTRALLSSKCTPLTITEPNPVIGPLAELVAVAGAPVPPLSTPPPQLFSARARNSAQVRAVRSIRRALSDDMVILLFSIYRPLYATLRSSSFSRCEDDRWLAPNTHISRYGLAGPGCACLSGLLR